MYAPQIDNFKFNYGSKEYGLDKKSKELLDRLYSLISEIEPCGDDERRTVWIRAARGNPDDYGDFEMLLADGDVESREQFEENWRLDYPDEYYCYKLTTLQYRDWRTVALNGEPVIQIDPKKNGWERDISDYLEWMISEVENVLDMMKKGEYTHYILENLPYKYRTGVIATKEYWRLYPNAEARHFEKLSREECTEFTNLLAKSMAGNDGKPLGRIKEMTLNKYLEISKIGYDANRLEGYETKTPLEMYKRYADGRDGGLLKLDSDSPKAFEEWYNIPDKWVIENPSHLWEAIAGSSRTRLHLYVDKDEGGYFLTLSQNEFCCPEEAVRFFIALSKSSVPVCIYNGIKIEKYLSGEGKTGIIPCFDEPWKYFYGGFDDRDVCEFINLPDDPCEELIERISWENIPEVRLIGEQ